MNLHLIRETYSIYGVMGELYETDSGCRVCYTLERAYPATRQEMDEKITKAFIPKVAAGIYHCVRRPPDAKFKHDTFELQNVPPFRGTPVTGIFIHKGNFNGDSEGCILIGAELGTSALLQSQSAFDALMNLQKGCDEFTLAIE